MAERGDGGGGLTALEFRGGPLDGETRNCLGNEEYWWPHLGEHGRWVKLAAMGKRIFGHHYIKVADHYEYDGLHILRDGK